MFEISCHGSFCSNQLFICCNCVVKQTLFLLFSDSPAKNGLITAFYIGARVGIAVGWGALMVLTMEVYPTVIRYI